MRFRSLSVGMRRRSVQVFLRGFVVALSGCVALCALASPAPSPSLQLTVTRQSVVISNVSAGGTVILFSCSRESLSRAAGVHPVAKAVRDDDRDGVITITPPTGVPLRSVWIAVDEVSGAVAASSRPEFPLYATPIAASRLAKDAEGEIAALSLELPRAVTLLVRPGVGAWTGTVFDGDKHDSDIARNGRVQLTFEDMDTIDGKDKAPKHLKNGDVIAAIDPGHLDVFLTEIGK